MSGSSRTNWTPARSLLGVPPGGRAIPPDAVQGPGTGTLAAFAVSHGARNAGAHSSVVEHSPYKRGVRRFKSYCAHQIYAGRRTANGPGQRAKIPVRANKEPNGYHRDVAESRPRRGHGEDSIYYDQANHYWVAAVSLGYKGGKRVRRKVTGRTKTEVRTKLRNLRRDLDSGVRTSATYTVGDALDDWLANGLSGRSDRTRELYRDTVEALREPLGEVKLRELTAGDVQETLDALAGRLSTRSLQITRLCLERAIRHAEVRDLVGRNVAALVKAPAGRSGRPSKSLTLEQAQDLLRVAASARLYAYVVLSVTTGLRTEELRALRWNEVDLDVGTVAVYRAVRATADTKTPKSRRVLSLPRSRCRHFVNIVLARPRSGC